MVKKSKKKIQAHKVQRHRVDSISRLGEVIGELVNRNGYDVGNVTEAVLDSQIRDNIRGKIVHPICSQVTYNHKIQIVGDCRIRVYGNNHSEDVLIEMGSKNLQKSYSIAKNGSSLDKIFFILQDELNRDLERKDSGNFPLPLAGKIEIRPNVFKGGFFYNGSSSILETHFGDFYRL